MACGLRCLLGTGLGAWEQGLRSAWVPLPSGLLTELMVLRSVCGLLAPEV